MKDLENISNLYQALSALGRKLNKEGKWVELGVNFCKHDPSNEKRNAYSIFKKTANE